MVSGVRAEVADDRKQGLASTPWVLFDFDNEVTQEVP